MRIPKVARALIVMLTVAVVASGARAVVNGQPADEGEYPWMAAIYSGSPDGGQYCGGSLVHERYVVSAAHCFFTLIDNTIARLPVDILGLKVKVLLGRTALSGEGGEEIAVRRVHIAPGGVDLAVLELAEASAQQPIDIAHPSDSSFYAAGVLATVTGWGATAERGRGSDVLLEATVPIVSDDDCVAAYGGSVQPELEVCAGYEEGGTDTCQGDSGGPLTVPGPNGPLLAGVTSWGDGCARPGKPGVYAEVAAASEFIDGFIEAA